MYEWLTDSLERSATIVTANRRLARTLLNQHAENQKQQGRSAWQTPAIFAWQDWLATLAARATIPQQSRARIGVQQSQWVWEQCLKKTLPDLQGGTGNLVRLARDARQLLSDWQVDLDELQNSCQNADQRYYAQALQRYVNELHERHWIDDAGLSAEVLAQCKAGRVAAPERLTLAGFDRVRPIVGALVDALADLGSDVCWISTEGAPRDCPLRVYDNPEQEYRAAGQWARRQLRQSPDAHVAIVTPGLDNAEIVRWVREGATPGWQYANTAYQGIVNVSYGQPLARYPAIQVALLCLRWSFEDIPARDVSVLLRSACLGTTDANTRAKIELQMRNSPDREWSPAMMGALFKSDVEATADEDWFSLLAKVSKRRRELPEKASPSQWALLFDETLETWRWPGQGSLESNEFQLINRWKEVLNELARLTLVSNKMSAATAFRHLQAIAHESVYQPEANNACIQLIGPLEAAGMEFDRLWVCGMSANNWPATGSASRLISRRLQEQYGMPDATPENTAAYASQTVQRLLLSAPTVQCSYARTVEDSEQTLSTLLAAHVRDENVDSVLDPGWHADKLRVKESAIKASDEVPIVAEGEDVSGGAATVQRQINEPVSAFISARLHARTLYPQAQGITPAMRGNLIHDALYFLYRDLPALQDVRQWSEEEAGSRVSKAVDAAFSRYEKQSGAVLLRVFKFERERVARLLQSVIELDKSGLATRIAAVEGELYFRHKTLQLRLRFDRVDQFEDSRFAILDYKTGAEKRLLSHKNEIMEIQLFVYALAYDAPVDALALLNIDSRKVATSGAGRGFSSEEYWPQLSTTAREEIELACEQIIAGDVRVNIEQGAASARALNLLTRYTELRRDRS